MTDTRQSSHLYSVMEAPIWYQSAGSERLYSSSSQFLLSRTEAFFYSFRPQIHIFLFFFPSLSVNSCFLLPDLVVFRLFLFDRCMEEALGVPRFLCCLDWCVLLTDSISVMPEVSHFGSWTGSAENGDSAFRQITCSTLGYRCWENGGWVLANWGMGCFPKGIPIPGFSGPSLSAWYAKNYKNEICYSTNT